MKDHDNKSIEVPPFYVGQEVVAVESFTNNSGARIIRGMDYVVKGIAWFPCGCCAIDVGLKSPPIYHHCSFHGASITITLKPLSGVAYFHTRRFRPKIEFTDFLSLKQVAEQTLETTGAN